MPADGRQRGERRQSGNGNLGQNQQVDTPAYQDYELSNERPAPKPEGDTGQFNGGSFFVKMKDKRGLYC